MKEHPIRYDALIVGGGHNGLVAASYLAKAGKSVLAPCRDGGPALEVKTPLDLEHDVALPRGNIFHRDLDFPFLEDGEAGDRPRWGAETDDPRILLAAAGARRGGGVSGIAGHNAAMAVLGANMSGL